MENFWIQRANAIIEQEVVLVRQAVNNQTWFRKMGSVLPAIHCNHRPVKFDDFRLKVGNAHNLRLTRFGIEGILKAPRKFQRCNFYVYFDNKTFPDEPFWVVLHD